MPEKSSCPLGNAQELESSAAGAWLRTASGRSFHPLEERAERANDGVVPLAEEGREDVLADALAPDVVTAVAARDRHRVQIYPVIVIAPNDVVPPIAYAASLELEAPLEAVQIDAARSVEIDVRLCHFISRV